MRPASLIVVAVVVACRSAVAGPPSQDERAARVAAVRARLAELEREERRLGGAAAIDSSQHDTSQHEAVRLDGEVAFERARLASVRARLNRAREQAAAAAPSAAAAEVSPPVEVDQAPPTSLSGWLRLADARLLGGDGAAALVAYREAAALAEAGTDPRSIARARYGVARALELAGQDDEAAAGFAAVEGMPDGGPWARAARSSRTFISWRREVASRLVAREVRR